MEPLDESSKNTSPIDKSTNKSSLKILEEVDKEIIQDIPPNFSSYIFSRIHDNPDGQLHG